MMLQTEEIKGRLRLMRGRLIISLFINGLLPLMLYFLLRQIVASDAAGLALAGALPAVRTTALWLWRRRADWIGVLATLSFVAALAITFISGGSPLALELRGSILTGAIGLLCLISLCFEKPLLVELVKVLARNTQDAPPMLNSQRLTTLTAVIGFALLSKTTADIVMALTLPTATFVAASHVVNWVILGSGLAIAWWTGRRIDNKLRDSQ